MKINVLSQHNTNIDYYMQEGCGIFSYALSKVFPGGTIGIISNKYGEKWSKSIPFELTHVIYVIDDNLIDVKGPRHLSSILQDFELSANQYTTLTYSPDVFRKKFLGSNDSKPLYGSKKDIAEAQQLIMKNMDVYFPRRKIR